VTSALTQADHVTLRARLAATVGPEWRTRFAPAPTGHLHLGHAVNAVYVWSIARAFAGSVIVRIEDHDRQRSRQEYETSIHDDLNWLGLHGDNLSLGLPDRLRQSDADHDYAAALTALERRGIVYPCRCSRREIASLGQGETELRYPGTCRPAGVSADATPARRLQLDDRALRFDDLRHGTLVQQPSAQCGDLLLRDRFGQWTYQCAVVVDDLSQGIDVIIRGDDLLGSTARQRMLAEALGASTLPLLLHHPLITHPDGTKLSKSRGDTGLRELRSAGWSPEHVLGHAAWLGGLQREPAPLPAANLARLWTALDANG